MRREEGCSTQWGDEASLLWQLCRVKENIILSPTDGTTSSCAGRAAAAPGPGLLRVRSELHWMWKLDSLIYPSFPKKQFNPWVPPRTDSVFLPTMSGPATSRDKISHPLHPPLWSPQPVLSENTAASCTEGIGDTGTSLNVHLGASDEPDCHEWKATHPLTFPGSCQATTAETHQDILGEKQWHTNLQHPTDPLVSNSLASQFPASFNRSTIFVPF